MNAGLLKAVSFTGSCATGEWLHAEASKRRLRIQLEMGGKNPTIVLADADFNAAVVTARVKGRSWRHMRATRSGGIKSQGRLSMSTMPGPCTQAWKSCFRRDCGKETGLFI